MNRAQKAAEYHQKGYNCAQAIVCAFCDKVGLDEKTAFKVSEGLGLGVSDTSTPFIFYDATLGNTKQSIGHLFIIIIILMYIQYSLFRHQFSLFLPRHH